MVGKVTVILPVDVAAVVATSVPVAILGPLGSMRVATTVPVGGIVAPGRMTVVVTVMAALGAPVLEERFAVRVAVPLPVLPEPLELATL